MAQNEAPSTSSFCLEAKQVEELPIIRFIGGIQLEPQIDATKGGGAGSCGVSLDLIGPLQSALAPFQPFLTLMDAFASLAQCFILLTEVVSDPTKIPDLLGCIPSFVQKLATLLQLVPVFPTGIQAFVTFIIDVVRFVATTLSCIIEILESVQGLFSQIGQIQAQLEETDDAEIRDGLQVLLACSQDEAAQQVSASIGALGPIARLLCTTRAILSLLPGGNEIQKQLAFGDPSNIAVLDDAITALALTRDVLLLVEDTVVALTAGLGALPPPGPAFICPLDDVSDEEEEPTPAAIPVLAQILGPDGVTPTSTIPQAPGGAGPDAIIVLVGTGIDAATQVFWGTAQISDVTVVDATSLRVAVPPGVRSNLGTQQLALVNLPPGGGGGPFSGLAEPGDDPDTGVEVSNQLPIEVV